MTGTNSTRIVVVGIGADGWAGLAEASRAELAEAETILGSRRQLATLPETVSAERRPWPSPLLPVLAEELARVADRRIAVLASGDPLVSGIGSTLIDLLGAERVRIMPAVSSISLARARMGWASEGVEVISVVGRDVDLVRRQLTAGARLLVLSAGSQTPADVAKLLVDNGFGESGLTVLADLGAGTESRIDTTPLTWSPDTAVSPLNILAIAVVAAASSAQFGWTAGLPDDAYEHDGQLTKRDLRASALARLAPAPGQLLWDIGAGAGSVAIEWARAHPRCRSIAVERDPLRAARIRRNCSRLGVPGVQVVEGAAPSALDGLPGPDAVFVGGGVTSGGLLEVCFDALRPGGRLVAHAVTLESEQVLFAAYRRHGGELTRIEVARAAPLGTFTGWTTARPVTQLSVIKPVEHPEVS